MAINTDSVIRNPDSVTLDGGIILSKTAKPVEGYVNKYEVTLKIESPRSEKTSDTVIVIDRSGSMKGDKLAKAKEAAKSLSEKLLSSGQVINKVAVVSFAENVTTDINFTNNYSMVSSAIDGLTASGGTFTQAAIRMAANLIGSSSAAVKNIVFLSDGEPTYSYGITNPRDYLTDDYASLVWYHSNGRKYTSNAKETRSDISVLAFEYNEKIGNGMGIRSCINAPYLTNCSELYNHGNSAIAEAGFYKASGVGNLYTIALDAGDEGTPVLRAMASPGKSYTAEVADLKKIFDEIGGSILSTVQSARITDIMGQGVIVSETGADSLNWNLTAADFVYDDTEKVYVAQKTYVVEFTDDLDWNASTDGFYPLNTEAIINYTDLDGRVGTGTFPVPEANPMAIKITKNVLDNTGKSAGAKFEVKLTDLAGATEIKTIGNNETVTLLRAFRIGNYELREIGVMGNINLENYVVSYNGGDFVIAQNQTTDAEVVVTNKYEETSLEAIKEWRDDYDRDGKRGDYDLYVAVKDGNNYVSYKPINAVDTTQFFTFDGLPKYRNNAEIEYEVAEAQGCNNGCKEFKGDAIYGVDIENGKIANTYTPEMKAMTIKKIWGLEAGTLPTAMPGFVTVEVSNDKNNEVATIVLSGGGYGEWTGAFSGYKYENGEEINYSIKETDIAGNLLNSESTLYVYNEGVLEGKWVASYVNIFDVKNTWTPATAVYNGDAKFEMKKINEKGDAMRDVVFEINGDEYVTNDDGKFEVEIKGNTEKAEESFKYSIREISTLGGYDLIEGTETLKVTSTSSLESVDEQNLINIYKKEYKFRAGGMAGYIWNDGGMYIVTNNRSMAKSLTIEKIFSGVSERALSGLTFTITGPEDFGINGELVIGFSNDCLVSGNKATCNVNAEIPTGKYTVKENNVEIANYTLTVYGDGQEKND